MQSRRISLLLIWLISLTFLTSCTEETAVTISEITAEEVLTLDPEADIFKYNTVIYQTNIEWVDELILTPGGKVMTVQNQSTDLSDFSDGTANLLPLGTDIFEANERSDILIAEVDGDYIYYLEIVEG